MNIRCALLFGLIFFPMGGSIALGDDVLELSRDSGVKLFSESGNSTGSGFYIGEQHLLTCFHVVAAVKVQGKTVEWNIRPDLRAVLPSGEMIDASVVSVPTKADPSPLLQDFALVKLKTKPSKKVAMVKLASVNETLKVGDMVVFSGYPLKTPGMVTHRGMVSGFGNSGSLIFVQASVR
jgi:V8-like Glu-specific endopeptidase